MSANVTIKKKLNIKEKIDDDKLDLSLHALESVPVKEISAFPKVRKLNLSFNCLTTLPEDFIKLINIRELDLSKNKLKALPKNFGQLVNLRNLDLLGNELTSLPSTFSELKSLQWLDLKDNPLKPQLKQAAGDCLDEAQCKKCAINVLRFIRTQSADEERQKQAELKKKREEQLKKELEDKEKENSLKLMKKAEREQRRLINEQKRAEREAENIESIGAENDIDNRSGRNGDSKTKKKPKRGLLAAMFVSTFYLLILTSILIASYTYLSAFCNSPKQATAKNSTSSGFLSNQYVKTTLHFVETRVCPNVIEFNKLLPVSKIDEILEKLEFLDILQSLF